MSPRFVALTDLGRFASPVPVLGRLCALAAAGTVAVVLRDREAALSLRLEIGRALRDMTADTGQFLLVSDRVDLALELGADGVHLPTGGLLPSESESLYPGAFVSRAHHGVEQLPPEELQRCAFLLVSPAFAERKGRPALGRVGLATRLTELRRKAPSTRLLALGGIDGQSLGSAISAGADGVAAIGAAHDAAEHTALLSALGTLRR